MRRTLKSRSILNKISRLSYTLCYTMDGDTEEKVMIKELQNIIYKEANDKYVECHNAVRHFIEDHVGTIENDVVDKIMVAILERYKV